MINGKRRRGPRRIDGRLMDLQAVADEVGVSVATARARWRRGDLPPPRRWGNGPRARLVFVRSEVEAYLANLPRVVDPAAFEEEDA